MKKQYLSIIISLIMLTLISCEGGLNGEKNSSESAFWAKTYGGTGSDSAYSIQQTSDGGYIVAGYGDTFVAGFTMDLWVLKLNSDGTVAWQKAYRGIDDVHTFFIQQTSDAGYIVAGKSYDAKFKDFLVLKLNSDGTVAWQKTYGRIFANSMQQTSDGGYIVAGFGNAFDRADSDFLVLKLNSDGTIAWQKTYGGIDNEYAFSIQQTSDGGYIVAGESNGVNSEDFWILKLSSDGTVAWQKTYGGKGHDSAYFIQQTSDGGYIVAGNTYYFASGFRDFMVLKLNSDGTIAWQKTYDGAYSDYAPFIQQTSDGGYIMAGITESYYSEISVNLWVPNNDLWVLKLNSDGTVAWQKTYGGPGSDYAYSMQQTSDGGYIVAGSTCSFGAGSCDFWILKLASDGTINFNPNSGASTTDTSATVSDISVTEADTNATVTDTSATITDINAIVTDIYTTINQQAP